MNIVLPNLSTLMKRAQEEIERRQRKTTVKPLVLVIRMDGDTDDTLNRRHERALRDTLTWAANLFANGGPGESMRRTTAV